MKVAYKMGVCEEGYDYPLTKSPTVAFSVSRLVLALDSVGSTRVVTVTDQLVECPGVAILKHRPFLRNPGH